VAAISLRCLYKHYTTKDTYIHADFNPQTQRYSGWRSAL